MRRSITQNRNGYTLIEVFIAMMVFALGILALYRLQIAAIANNTYANQLTRATNLAESKIQELLQSEYSDSNLTDSDGDGMAGLDDTTSQSADHSDSEDIYSIYWNVATDQPIAHSKTIRLIVCWTDSRDPNNSCAHRIVLDCIKAE